VLRWGADIDASRCARSELQMAAEALRRVDVHEIRLKELLWWVTWYVLTIRH